VNINKVEHAGLSIYAKAMILSQEAVQTYEQIRAMHQFHDGSDKIPAYF